MALGSPSMPYIFQEVVGPWGGAFISGGLIISIFGAWLSYTILASEAMNRMAQMELLPRFFVRLNAHNAPTACLVTSGIMIQILSIVMLFSEAAYQFAYSLCTASIVISWGLASAYMVKLSGSQRHGGKGGAFALSLFATVFLTVAILLAGIDLLMLCCIAYVPGIVFFRDGPQGARRLSRDEALGTRPRRRTHRHRPHSHRHGRYRSDNYLVHPP